MRQAYPSDVTRQQFEVIRHIFESLRETTSTWEYDLYDIFCEILYIVKGGYT